jgi:opacity protein-like surface antigen
MKKSVLFLALLPLLAVAGFAQESRQDASISGTVFISPQVTGNAVHQTSTIGDGVLGSYRYMLTPRSALEANYQYLWRYKEHYHTSFNNVNVRSTVQEFSAAYVFNFNFRNFNPFLEAGIGGWRFGPIQDVGTSTVDVKGSTQIGGLYGGGVAYELSPSWDIRLEYRGAIFKDPNLVGGQLASSFSTNRYYNLSNPVIGLAYHF